MKSLCFWSAVFVCLTVSLAGVHASAAECPANIPAGVIIRVLPDEKLIAGTASGPTILTVTSDVRFFPNRPPLLARGSKILGTIAESKQAGHFYGKAHLKIALNSILTSDFCEYPMTGKIVEAGRQNVKQDVVIGRGHAHRDILALLFPPTTVYQLLRIPSRGPKLVLDNETPLTIKLLESVSLSESSIRRTENERTTPTLRGSVTPTEREFSNIIPAALVPPNPRLPEEQPADLLASGPCAVKNISSGRPIVQRNKVMRPVRNLTVYHVTVYLDRTPLVILPPCYGPSMISTPATEFKLEAVATVLTPGGQTQVAVKIIPSAEANGWDVVPDASMPVVFKTSQ